MKRLLLIAACVGVLASVQTVASGQEQGVIVLINNTSRVDGTFHTPVWTGFHDGTFDIYDRNAAASSLPVPGSVALERLAEDGNTGPISSDFTTLQPNGVQGTLTSNVPGVPPLAPKQRISRLFRVDPGQNRYFSYATMVIPSNDAFVANGNPMAHMIFDQNGQFQGGNFRVLGNEVLDAGTEVNDELPQNTAFFGQMAPNTGVTENGTIIGHPGFLPAAAGGILADPMFANADFLAPNYRNLFFRFQTINLNSTNRFNGLLTADQEVDVPDVFGLPFGYGLTRTNNANTRLSFLIYVRGLSGDPTAAHLHVGLRRRNGPVAVDLINNGMLFGFQGMHFIFGEVDVADVVGPLATNEAPFDSLLAELATQGVYVNVHTAQNPAGEIRGQLFIQR